MLPLADFDPVHSGDPGDAVAVQGDTHAFPVHVHVNVELPPEGTVLGDAESDIDDADRQAPPEHPLEQNRQKVFI